MTARVLVRSGAPMVPAVVVAVAGGGWAVVAVLTALAVVIVALRVIPDLLAAPEGTAGAPRGSRFAAAARPRTDPPRRGPADLRRMETLVAARVQSATGVHNWLRPLVADIAATRLGQHGSGLVPDEATTIPDPLWALIRPDRPQPAARDAKGISLAELGTIVDQLEEL